MKRTKEAIRVCKGGGCLIWDLLKASPGGGVSPAYRWESGSEQCENERTGGKQIPEREPRSESLEEGGVGSKNVRAGEDCGRCRGRLSGV